MRQPDNSHRAASSAVNAARKNRARASSIDGWETVSIYVRAIGEVKKISKLLNAFGGEDKRSCIERRDLRKERKREQEHKIFRTGRSGREGREGGERRRWEDDEKSSYTFHAHTAVCIFTDACTFAPRDPRIGERRLFASRHLVAKPAGLFTYLPLRRAVCTVLLHRCVFRLSSLSTLFFFLFLPSLFARERFRTGVKENCQYRESSNLECVR